MKIIRWFGRDIDLDDIYFVAYPDQKREMTERELMEYDQALALPDKIRYDIIAKLDPRKNPNYLPVAGRELLDIQARGYIPAFDSYFQTSKRIMFFPARAMADYYGKHSTTLR